jgi:DHA1 family inner membrane transport protein
MASSLNIGAFNLGNALGAWLGGMVISQGLGLSALPWVAALVPASAFVVALWSLARDRREALPPRNALPVRECA